jgi:hypothetical protein
MKKRDIYFSLLLLLCIALPMITLAQGPPDPEDTPIDGGLSLLLAAGAAYGVKKYRDGRKKEGMKNEGIEE